MIGIGTSAVSTAVLHNIEILNLELCRELTLMSPLMSELTIILYMSTSQLR